MRQPEGEKRPVHRGKIPARPYERDVLPGGSGNKAVRGVCASCSRSTRNRPWAKYWVTRPSRAVWRSPLFQSMGADDLGRKP